MAIQDQDRRPTPSELPINEDLTRFAVPHSPEQFTDDETRLLSPFFSNLDRPVYALKNLPPEVVGALSSRYSRSDGRLRRVFLREYVMPMTQPETQPNWEKLGADEQAQALEMKGAFVEMVDFFNSGKGPEEVANLQRARKFFDTWLAQYGDDSIAEMGSVALCIEGASNVAVTIVEGQRIGVSPLEKSTRYVPFWERGADGQYQYVVPGEVKGTPLEAEYRRVQDLLFDTYAQLAEPYRAYIEEKYPKGDDETDRSFHASRGAKRFDDLRELLPFGTQTSLALNGNGRAFEQLINRLLSHPSGEVRWWGQQVANELDQVVPSFVRRARTERGAQVQQYRKRVAYELPGELAQSLPASETKREPGHWAHLVSTTPDADVEVLATYLFSGSTQPLETIRQQVQGLSPDQRTEMLAKILEERKLGDPEAKREHARFRKPPRAFENAQFLFEVYARGGDYRDLHRHRMVSHNRQPLTTEHGFDLERDVLESPFAEQIQEVLSQAATLHQQLKDVAPEAAEYGVPFAFLQHWYMGLSARELYWMGELRTGPQGRPHYREICQQMADQAIEASPAVMQGIMIDRNDYRLARRESEKKIDQRVG